MRKYGLLALAFMVVSTLAAGPSHAGTLVGKIAFDGTYNPADKATMDADTLIRAKRSFVVSDKKGLANVLIYLVGVPGEYPPPRELPQIDQKEKMFFPHVLPIIKGQKLEVLNTDGILHNLHAYTGNKTLFNVAMPPFRKHAIMDIDSDQVVMVGCDVHRHMRAWIVPVENPFFAVSRESGLFAINNVPAGSFTVRAWHEIFGTIAKKVTLKPGNAKTAVIFKFHAP